MSSLITANNHFLRSLVSEQLSKPEIIQKVTSHPAWIKFLESQVAEDQEKSMEFLKILYDSGITQNNILLVLQEVINLEDELSRQPEALEEGELLENPLIAPVVVAGVWAVRTWRAIKSARNARRVYNAVKNNPFKTVALVTSVINWEDTKEWWKVLSDLATALYVEKKIKYIYKNKAELATANIVLEDYPETQLFLTKFFRVFSRQSGKDIFSNQEKSSKKGENYRINQDLLLWQLNKTISSVLSEKTLLDTFDYELPIASEEKRSGRVFPDFETVDHVEIQNSFMSVYFKLKSGVKTSVISKSQAQSLSSLFATLFIKELQTFQLKYAHPQLFCLLCIDLVFDHFQADGFPLTAPGIGEFFEQPEINSSLSAREVSLNPNSLNEQDIYDDIPMGVSATDSSGAELAHDPGEMATISKSNNLKKVYFNNIFRQGPEILFAALKKDIINRLLLDNRPDKLSKEEFFKIVETYALTINLDPDGSAVGGYKEIERCIEWFNSDNFNKSGNKKFKDIDSFNKLVGNVLFYYPEYYLINKPFVAGVNYLNKRKPPAWQKTKKTYGQALKKLGGTGKGRNLGKRFRNKIRKQIIKSLKFGKWQNALLGASLWVGFALLDPLNMWVDKKKIVGILDDMIKKAESFKKIQEKEQGEVWAFTEEQNREVFQALYLSLEEVEKEVNQSIRQMFAWSNTVKQEEKKDIKDLEETCDIVFKRSQVHADFKALQGAIGQQLKELTSQNFDGIINYVIYDDFITIAEEGKKELSKIFEKFAVADISPMTGDVDIRENIQINEFFGFFGDDEKDTQSDTASKVKDAIEKAKDQIPDPLPIKTPEGRISVSSLRDSLTNLEADEINYIISVLNFYKIKNFDEKVLLNKILNEQDANSLVEIVSKDSLSISKMRSEYLRFRKDEIKPERNSMNRKYWNNIYDKKFGSMLKGSLPRRKIHISQKGGSGQYSIVACTDHFGVDSLINQSGIFGTFILDFGDSPGTGYTSFSESILGFRHNNFNSRTFLKNTRTFIIDGIKIQRLNKLNTTKSNVNPAKEESEVAVQQRIHVLPAINKLARKNNFTPGLLLTGQQIKDLKPKLKNEITSDMSPEEIAARGSSKEVFQTLIDFVYSVHQVHNIYVSSLRKVSANKNLISREVDSKSSVSQVAKIYKKYNIKSEDVKKDKVDIIRVQKAQKEIFTKFSASSKNQQKKLNSYLIDIKKILDIEQFLSEHV